MSKGTDDVAIRQRLEDLLVEIRTLVEPFKNDGGYSGRVYALVAQRVAGIATEYGHAIGDHPLYDAAAIDHRSSWKMG